MGEAYALVLVAVAAAVAAVARRRGWPAPLLLVLAGLAASFLPGVPDYTLDPDVVLLLFLPPLLFSAALSSSYLNFRRNIRPIALLSVGLVLVTTVVVGVTLHAVVPGMGLPVAFALGAIVAPPDAVAATAIGRELGLPRRLLTVLAGESLVNDATALTAYRVAVVAAVGGGFSLLNAAGRFGYAATVGLVFGGVVGICVRAITSWLSDPVLENTAWLLAPFLAFLPAERIGGSGVLAVVVAGLYLGHNSPRSVTYRTRLQATSLWRMVTFLLESVVFALIGLQLRGVLDGLAARPWTQLAADACLLVGVVILVRAAYVFPVAAVPRLLLGRRAGRTGRPSWCAPVVLSWAGMRGVVSLAAAFALPARTNSGAPFPDRDLVLFLTFCLVVATLLVQGLTLPAVIRRFGMDTSETAQDNLAEAAAQQAAARAALTRLDELLATETGALVPEEIVRWLRQRAEGRSLSAWERMGSGPGRGFVETPTASYRRLRREMLDAERRVFVELRDAGRIDDEVLRRVQRDLDFEEATLTRE